MNIGGDVPLGVGKFEYTIDVYYFNNKILTIKSSKDN